MDVVDDNDGGDAKQRSILGIPQLQQQQQQGTQELPKKEKEMGRFGVSEKEGTERDTQSVERKKKE